MFDHEHFRMLSSLAATGQLVSDENVELTKHLLECEACVEIYNEYSHLVQHQLPQAHLARYGNRPLPLEFPPSAEIRDKFLGRLRTEGASFTPNAERPTRPHRSYSSTKWQLSPWPLAVASAALAAVVFFGILLSRKRTISAPTTPIDTSVIQANENRGLINELGSLRHEKELSSQELDRLRREKDASDGLLRRSQMDLRESQALADKLLAENQAEKTSNAILSDGDQKKDGVIANLRAQDDKVDRQRADELADLVVERQRNRELSESLDLQNMNLERERQLQSVTSDVRRLMGARNLHIIDVRDINLDRGSAKAFGRVFYAEGQSLIFYAFDLPNSGITPAKYTFQAWGGQDSSSKSPRNLGTFDVDDHEQHRWILKVDDPKQLAGIDSVFVTAESIRDAREPRGKKLLHAYIAGQPNHP